MATSKSSSKAKETKATIKRARRSPREEQERTNYSKFLSQFPFILDNSDDESAKDAGIHWWHVKEPEYWGQGVEVGKSFADRIVTILPKNPQKVEETLRTSLGYLLLEGGSNGVATGFLHQLAHYACKGMQQEGARQ